MANYTKQYLKYDPCELVCLSHNVRFVRFDCGYRVGPKGLRYKLDSHGCPVCVGLIRAKVQMEISRGTKIGSHGKRVRTAGIRVHAGRNKGSY
mgnify:CR=1 FL=1